MASVYGSGELLYQDDQCMVFEVDTEDKQAPIHFQVVPRKVVARPSAATKDDEKKLGHLLTIAKTIASQRGLVTGYHVTLDEDPRAVRLRALHVFERALHHMLWPVGPGFKL